jgi:hypothetical protein
LEYHDATNLGVFEMQESGRSLLHILVSGNARSCPCRSSFDDGSKLISRSFVGAD